MEYSAPPVKVAALLDSIRKNMDTEFGREQKDRQRIVEERRNSVLELMRFLDRPNEKPPMRLLNDIVSLVRTRGAATFDDDISSLFDLLTNNLSNFSL
eukprot:symbB.v1.2.009231.t1/scaffold583.1/size184467/3